MQRSKIVTGLIALLLVGAGSVSALDGGVVAPVERQHVVSPTVASCEAETEAVARQQAEFDAARERSVGTSMAYAKAAQGLIKAEKRLINRAKGPQRLAIVNAFLPMWHSLNYMAVTHSTVERNRVQAELEALLEAQRALATCRGTGGT